MNAWEIFWGCVETLCGVALLIGVAACGAKDDGEPPVW